VVSNADGIQICGMASLQGKMLRYIEDISRNRKFKVSHNREETDEKTITIGVPQGLSLSPALFNFIADIPIIHHTVLTGCADDLALVVSGSEMVQCEQRMHQIS
jgi:hypothetical protein